MKFLFLSLLFLLLLSSPILAEENFTINESTDQFGETWEEVSKEPEPICEEQLEICVSEFNDLTLDCSRGKFCGMGFQMVVDNNQGLGEKLENCREDVGKYKNYKNLLFLLLILIGIWLIYSGYKNYKNAKESK